MTIVSRFTPSAYLLDGGEFTPPVTTITRYAPQADGVSTYIQFPETYILTGDFEISGYFECSSSLGIGHLFTNTSDAKGRFVIYWNGSEWRAFSSGQYGSSDSGAVTDSSFIDGGIHKIRISRTSSTVSWFYDDNATPFCSYNDGAVLYYVDSLFSKWAGDTSVKAFSGIAYDISIGGDFWAFDEEFSEYPSLTSDTGKIATAYNFTASDIVEVDDE